MKEVVLEVPTNIQDFVLSIQKKFADMCTSGKLFRSSISGQQVWDQYLKGFTKDQDPIFRDPESSQHNCNLCKNFVRRYGNIVSINPDNSTSTMFDVITDEEYQGTASKLSEMIKGGKIQEVFFETFNELNELPYEKTSPGAIRFQLGIHQNIKRYTKEEAEKFGVVKPNEVRTFKHMHLFVPKEFVDQTGASIESIQGNFRDSKNVFQRAMEEISLDTLNLVKDLIIQGSLLNGDSHLFKIEQMIPIKEEYDRLKPADRDNWCWVKSYRFPLAKFKNELIGVLCSELSQGEELNKACLSWNKRVDPANYMKASAPITKKQIEEAQKFVQENGYTESFDRRLAQMDDIKVSEVLHSNIGSGIVKPINIFDGIKSTSTRHKRNEFEGLEEVQIDKFMKDILPTCSNIEAFLSNTHAGNMCTLTKASTDSSKPIFKWSNNYSWTFNGNLAGKSEIKEAVKTAGGKVDGILRCSMMWSGPGSEDNSDLDLHCQEPTGEIYFGNKRVQSGGNLDIDITQPLTQMKSGAVENITYPQVRTMRDGVYKFFIHQFSARNSKGFRAEIEFNGITYSYEYLTPVRQYVQVAEVTLKDGEFSIKHILPESAVSSKEIYGLESNQFHKVNLVCLSPNHWGDSKVGNKHFMFILDKCKSPTSIRSFHNENLIPELLLHRKVLEVLGSSTNIPSTEPQLSGLGFNSTVRDELIVKLGGTHKRMLKIKF